MQAYECESIKRVSLVLHKCFATFLLQVIPMSIIGEACISPQVVGPLEPYGNYPYLPPSYGKIFFLGIACITYIVILYSILGSIEIVSTYVLNYA